MFLKCLRKRPGAWTWSPVNPLLSRWKVCLSGSGHYYLRSKGRIFTIHSCISPTFEKGVYFTYVSRGTPCTHTAASCYSRLPSNYVKYGMGHVKYRASCQHLDDRSSICLGDYMLGVCILFLSSNSSTALFLLDVLCST